MKKCIVYLIFFTLSHVTQTSVGTTECYPLVLSCETLALKSYPADCHTDQIFFCLILFLFFLLSYENGFKNTTFTRDRWQRLTSKLSILFIPLSLFTSSHSSFFDYVISGQTKRKLVSNKQILKKKNNKIYILYKWYY